MPTRRANTKPRANQRPIQREAMAHIARVAPKMARVIDVVGPCRLPYRRQRYSALIRTIVGQQVSTKAAQSVYDRLQTQTGGFVTALRVAALTDSELRACGLSRQKRSYIRDLTERVQARTLRLDRLSGLDDEAVIEELTQVKGLGPWSAEMFLMFVLNRPDVLSTGDLGLQNGLIKVYGLRKRPSPKRMEQLTRPWRPFRSTGCWYLWRSLDAAL